MANQLDLPAIRERAAAFEAAQEAYHASKGLTWGSPAFSELMALARNTTLAADVRGLCAEIERLRMLFGEQQ